MPALLPILLGLVTWVGFPSARTVEAASSGCESDSTQCVGSPEIDIAREMVITDLSVVDSSLATGMGPWSFGRLMTDLAPEGMPASEFVKRFFETWIASTAVDAKDFWTITAGGPDQPDLSAAAVRTEALQRFLDYWPRDENGRLDLVNAPFRLMAIVNRLDVREGRLSYVFISPPSNPIPGYEPGIALDAGIIIEYGLPSIGPRGTLQDDRWWAERWHQLTEYPLRSVRYRNALRKLTDLFTKPGSAPGRPSGSALKAVNTNEQISDPGQFSLGAIDPVWQLRSFKLDPATGELVVAPLIDTPDLDYDTYECTPDSGGPCQQELIDYLVENRDEILAGEHEIDPNQIELGITGPQFTPAFRWLPDVAPPAELSQEEWEELRLEFALLTCNGCHSGDGNNNDNLIVPQEFQQLSFREPGVESRFSPHLQEHLETVRIPLMQFLLDD